MTTDQIIATIGILVAIILAIIGWYLASKPSKDKLTKQLYELLRDWETAVLKLPKDDLAAIDLFMKSGVYQPRLQELIQKLRKVPGTNNLIKNAQTFEQGMLDHKEELRQEALKAVQDEMD